MTKELLRTERGERIDHPDFEHATETSQRETMAQMVSGVLIGGEPTQNTDQLPHYVLQGFETSVAAGTQVTVAGGIALLSFREGGVPQPGAVLSGGPTSKTIDMLNYPDGTYGAFVRFNFREGGFLNRLFWNPLAVPPVEVPRNIPTRKTESWDVAIEKVAMGSEWLKVASLSKSGGTVTPTDDRDLYFEGKASAQYLVPNTQWGSVSDRLDSRSDNGVFGFRRFIRAVQRQLQDVIGTTIGGWWADAQAGSAAGNGPRSLVQLNAEKFGRSGQQTLQGDILPDTANAYDLGNALANRFATGYIQALTVGDGTTPGGGGVGPFIFTSNAYCGTEFNPFETAAFANSLLSAGVGDVAKVGGGYLVVATNVTGGAGNPAIIELNDTLLETQADSHIARIVTTYTPGAGAGFLDIQAGIFGSLGARSIRLAGTDVRLAVTCGGQNGLAYATRASMLGFNIGLTGAPTTLSIAFTGNTFGVGDTVLALTPDLDLQNGFATNSVIMAGTRIVGVDTVEVTFAHTLDPATTGAWALTSAMSLDIVVLRR